MDLPDLRRSRTSCWGNWCRRRRKSMSRWRWMPGKIRWKRFPCINSLIWAKRRYSSWPGRQKNVAVCWKSRKCSEKKEASVSEVHRHFAFWRDICSDRAIRFMKPKIHRSWSGSCLCMWQEMRKQRQNLRHGRSGIWCVKRICVTGILPWSPGIWNHLVTIWKRNCSRKAFRVLSTAPGSSS